MDLRLASKVAVVTGASKGIGLAVTRALVAEGVSVVAAARSLTDALSQLSTEGQVHPVQVDLGTPEGPARLIDEAVVAYGGPDILINNVGALRPRLDGFLSNRRLAMGTDHQLPGRRPHHPRGATTPARARCRHHRQHVFGQRRPSGPTGHRLQRRQGALLNFSKALSKEVGPKGVRVNTVSPGPVATPLWLGDDGVAQTVARASGGEAGDVAKQAADDTVTGRFTHPEEVADLIVLLASERAGNVTGSDFVIDGGLITTL